MELTADTIYEAAVRLPEGQRLDLVSRIMDSLPGPPGLLSIDDPNLIQELDRRSADDAGSVP
jgi:hypothetical protein